MIVVLVTMTNIDIIQTQKSVRLVFDTHLSLALLHECLDGVYPHCGKDSDWKPKPIAEFRHIPIRTSFHEEDIAAAVFYVITNHTFAA